MPRMPRKKSEADLYHIMLRGAGRRIIFFDKQDYEQFLNTIRQVKAKAQLRLYAYCLMDNHVHLLIKEGDESLGMTFKRVGVSYAHYYNWKYQLTGHLFQDRYRSEAIDTDAYFLDAMRYICNNPVKAGIFRNFMDYPWLGCSGISDDTQGGLLDDLGTLTDLRGEKLLKYLRAPCDNAHIEIDDSKRLTDQEATIYLCRCCGCVNPQDIGNWDTARRDAAIRTGRNGGVSIRQLSRLTNVSRAVIERVGRR